MADVKKTGAVTGPSPPPPPPPILDTNSAQDLANGVCPAGSSNKGGIPKPRPPAKPSKLSRAFSAGSLTLGRRGKKGKKNSLQENNVLLTNGESSTIVNGGHDENEGNAPRKLPGIGTKPVLRKISFRKSRPDSIAESLPNGGERDLPPCSENSGEETKAQGGKDRSNSNGSTSPTKREFQPVSLDSPKRGLPPIPCEEIEDSISPAAPNHMLPAMCNGSDSAVNEPMISASKIGAPTAAENDSVVASSNELCKKDSSPTSTKAGSFIDSIIENADHSRDDVGIAQNGALEEKPISSKELGAAHHLLVDQNTEKSDSNDDADIVSECSLSSAENSQEEKQKSSTSLSQVHNTSISSAEQGTANEEDLTESAATNEVEYKDFYTIGEIVNSYSYAIPVSMKILQGYCSDTSDVNISTDDIYLLHSIRHSSMVTIRDEDFMTHRVPIHHPVKVGLIYNPRGNYEESLGGYEFSTVADILSMPSPPKLIYAKQDILAGDDKNNVSKGEILSVGHTNKSMFKSKRGLKVFSLLTKTKKVLLDSSGGCFSTNPSLVKLDFSSFVESFAESFPAQVVVYPNSIDSASTVEFPGSRSRVATVLGCKTETALAVSDISTVMEEEASQANLLPIPTESPTSFDLLLDDDIAALEVIVQRWTYPEENEEDIIAETADEITENFYDDTVSTLAEERERSNENKSLSESTSSLEKRKSSITVSDPTYMNVSTDLLPPPLPPPHGLAEREKNFLDEDEDAGYDTVGLHLIGGSSPTLTSKQPSNSASGTFPSASDLGYSRVARPALETPVPPPPPSANGYSKIGPKTVASAKKPAAGYSEVHPHSTMNGFVVEEHKATLDLVMPGNGKQNVSAAEKEAVTTSVPAENSELSKMQVMLEILTKKMESVDTQLVHLATTPANSADPVTTDKTEEATPNAEMGKEDIKAEKPSTEEENLDFLRSLEVEQVGELISTMGLDQYVEKVTSEQISGEILLECDESILKDEIGITSKIHRIRLMKVISGQHSAKGILDKKKTSKK